MRQQSHRWESGWRDAWGEKQHISAVPQVYQCSQRTMGCHDGRLKPSALCHQSTHRWSFVFVPSRHRVPVHIHRLLNRVQPVYMVWPDVSSPHQYNPQRRRPDSYWWSSQGYRTGDYHRLWWNGGGGSYHPLRHGNRHLCRVRRWVQHFLFKFRLHTLWTCDLPLVLRSRLDTSAEGCEHSESMMADQM